jgi:hypothetical protein
MASPATSPASSLYRSSSQNSESSGRSTPPPATPSFPLTASFSDFNSGTEKAFLAQAKYLDRAGSVRSAGLSRAPSLSVHTGASDVQRRWAPGHRTGGAGAVSIDEIQRRFGGGVGGTNRSGSVSSRASVDYGRGANIPSVSKRGTSVDYGAAQLSSREASARPRADLISPPTNGYSRDARATSPLAPSSLPNSSPTSHRYAPPKSPTKILKSEPSSRLSRSSAPALRDLAEEDSVRAPLERRCATSNRHRRSNTAPRIDQTLSDLDSSPLAPRPSSVGGRNNPNGFNSGHGERNGLDRLSEHYDLEDEPAPEIYGSPTTPRGARFPSIPSSPTKSPRKDWRASPDVAGITDGADEVAGKMVFG